MDLRFKLNSVCCGALLHACPNCASDVCDVFTLIGTLMSDLTLAADHYTPVLDQQYSGAV